MFLILCITPHLIYQFKNIFIYILRVYEHRVCQRYTEQKYLHFNMYVSDFLGTFIFNEVAKYICEHGCLQVTILLQR